MNLESALLKFDLELKKQINEEYQRNYKNLDPVKNYPTYNKGQKYIKIISDKSCWGFISKVDGMLKGSPIKVGDLLKAANYNTPAKHSRGNIIDGTAMYSIWGPTYLK